MRLIHLVALILYTMLGLLAWLLLLPEPDLATGVTHAQFPGMNAGGDGRHRLGAATVPIFGIGALTMLLMALLPALGVQPRHRDRVFAGLLVLVIGAGQIVWWFMFTGYLDFHATGEPRYTLGFPAATSWMLFGVWLAGALLCFIYVIGFRRFVLTEEDEAAYEALRAEAAVPRVPPPDTGQR